MLPLTLQTCQTNSLFVADRPRCTSVVVNNCDVCENIHSLTILQDIHTPMVYMVCTYYWPGLYWLYSRHHPRRVSCLPTFAILLGHHYRGRALWGRVFVLCPHRLHQHNNRCDGTSFAHSKSDEPGDVVVKKTDSHRHIHLRPLHLHCRCLASAGNFNH